MTLVFFFLLPPRHNFLGGNGQLLAKGWMSTVWQAELLQGGERGLLTQLWVKWGQEGCRLCSVSCGFGWTRPCYALFPLPSASRASHCAVPTADIGLAGKTESQQLCKASLVAAQINSMKKAFHRWCHNCWCLEVEAIIDSYIWINWLTLLLIYLFDYQIFAHLRIC